MTIIIQHIFLCKVICLIILYIWIEVGIAYFQSFVSCSLGIGMVGYVMMSRAACYTIASYLSGKSAQYLHRSVHFTIAMALYAVVVTIWLLWQPHRDQLWLFFFVACLEGIGSGIWRVQIGGKMIWSNSNALLLLTYFLDPF